MYSRYIHNVVLLILVITCNTVSYTATFSNHKVTHYICPYRCECFCTFITCIDRKGYVLFKLRNYYTLTL